MAFAIKATIETPLPEIFAFREQKTMYGGKRIAVGDEAFIFAAESAGGRGLIARAVVTAVEATPRIGGVARQTPRVSVVLRRTALATRPLGRAELKSFIGWNDGSPETELNFKFYRQATNKIVGVSDATAAFLGGFFQP